MTSREHRQAIVDRELQDLIDEHAAEGFTTVPGSNVRFYLVQNCMRTIGRVHGWLCVHDRIGGRIVVLQ